jgi:uncharacterized membrane protein/protein-disulfide isomerase
MSAASFPSPLRHSVHRTQAIKTANRSQYKRSSHQISVGTQAMFAASLLACATSVYLAWAAFTMSPVAGCSSGQFFDCEHVLHSRWSKVLSVPVSVPAVALHVSVMVALVMGVKRLSPIINLWRWRFIAFASFCAAFAAVWFTGLQLVWLNHLCPYCLVAHAAGLVLAAMVGVYSWRHHISLRSSSLAAVVAVSGLVFFQITTTPPPTFEVITHADGDADQALLEPATTFASPAIASPAMEQEDDGEVFDAPSVSADDKPWVEPPRGTDHASRASLLDLSLGILVHPSMLLQLQVATSGTPNDSSPAVSNDRRQVTVLKNVKLNVSDWPLIGSPNAEFVFVELFDYTCPHCQRTHLAIEDAKRKLGDRLAIVTLPVPLDAKCNSTVQTTNAKHAQSCELSKLAIAVWATDRNQFEAFHNYLFDQKPSYEAAMRKAEGLIPVDRLRKSLGSRGPADYIAKHVTLYQKAGSGTIVGAVESGDAITTMINQHAR